MLNYICHLTIISICNCQARYHQQAQLPTQLTSLYTEQHHTEGLDQLRGHTTTIQTKLG